MRRPLTARTLCSLLIFASAPALFAQDAKTAEGDKTTAKAFGSRKELNESYDARFAELDKRKIADLAALAPKLPEAEAEIAYSDLFHLAVTRDQYDAAEKAAEAFLEAGKGSAQTRALATFVNIMAADGRGQYDQAFADLDAFLKKAAASTGDSAVDPNLLYAVGEAFLQRLIKAREYGHARKVCSLFVKDSKDPQVKAHFTGRLKRLEMLGKPAPALAGMDIDGRKLSLADYKGKVVLVDFWATWAPPCVAQIPYYSSLQSKYGSKGFQVVGVNVDASPKGGAENKKAMDGVREALLAMRVSWPSFINGPGAQDHAKAYGVTDIPANFLIDRDGKIIQVELSDTDLEKAVEKALDIKPGAAGEKPGR